MDKNAVSVQVHRKDLKRSSRIDVKKLRVRSGLSQEDLARVLDTTWGSVSRWERGMAAPQPDLEGRLMRLSKLIEIIGDALEPGALPKFLYTPHPLLRGFAPAELLKSDYAFPDLVAFIEAAKSGDMG